MKIYITQVKLFDKTKLCLKDCYYFKSNSIVNVGPKNQRLARHIIKDPIHTRFARLFIIIIRVK